jgi:hypothetical protein
MIQRMVKEHGIEDFHQKYIDLIRKLVLNKNSADKKIDGRFFEENGMYISDVEISSLEFEDEEIEGMLNESQNEIVRQSLSIAKENRKLKLIEAKNEITQKINAKNAETTFKQLELEVKEKEKSLAVNLKDVENENKVETTRKENEEKRQGIYSKIAKAKIDIRKAWNLEDQSHAKAMIDIEGEKMVKESQAFVEKFKAITTELVQSLKESGDKQLAIEVSKNLSIHTLLGDKNLMEVLQGALGNTALGNNLAGLVEGYKNIKRVTGNDKE